MGDHKGGGGGGGDATTTKNQQHLSSSSSPKDSVEDQSTLDSSLQHPPPAVTTPVTGPPFISCAVPPLFIPGSGNFEQHLVVNTKRPRISSTTGQWKLLPSPSHHKQGQTAAAAAAAVAQVSGESQPQSSDTASSPSRSPRPSSQETNKPELGETPLFHQQFRKGKYVSPVWKPNEMLWLARAWRVQYQGCGFDPESGAVGGGEVSATHPPPAPLTTRGKTRADKDREVAEFLNRHGVSRDAKTAGTKWDNMLGEFRKVYEWERGGERDQIGKSYFRLSPYERKIHRLPASFDEDVFEELSQFMGSRMRTTQSRGATSALLIVSDAEKSLPPPSSHLRQDNDLLTARGKQLTIASGRGGETFPHGTRGGGSSSSLLGFETPPTYEITGGGGGGGGGGTSSSKELRRIGRVRMIWEESVSLWGEEGELHLGRVKVQGSSFLNANELTFLDDSMVVCAMEAFEDGPLKGFSVDRFVSGQQVKVYGRRQSSSSVPAAASGFNERAQPSYPEPNIRSMIPPWEFQDPTDYHVGCLRVPPPTLPTLYELSWHLQEPPPEDLRFPLRKDVYRDLPQGKELFFTVSSSELLDCRAFTFDILSSIIRPNPVLTSSSRDSFISLWDDCINRIISKFCPSELVFVRKPSFYHHYYFSSSTDSINTSTNNNSNNITPVQDQWPNLTGFIRNFCLWRGEETDQLREGHQDPSCSLVEKLLWTFVDLPYVLGYYAIGCVVTFSALSRSNDRIIRTDLYTMDLSTPAERLKALVPCWRIAGLLPLLADRCIFYSGNYKIAPYSDFERIDLGNGNRAEMTPNTVTRFLNGKRKWAAVKEIYDFLDRRIPHAEFLVGSSENDLALMFKPRGCRVKPTNCDQLVEALKQVTKALVALHDLSFMHRDLMGWDKVTRRSDREKEWILVGFDEAVVSPQMIYHAPVGGSGKHAPPEMGRGGLHTVKVDVWGVGQLVKSCGLVGLPKLLRELQSRCLEQNPELRPTAADCYHHLLQLQSSLSASAAGGYSCA